MTASTAAFLASFVVCCMSVDRSVMLMGESTVPESLRTLHVSTDAERALDGARPSNLPGWCACYHLTSTC